MKFVPRHSQIIGRMVIKRPSSKIVLPDEKKITKFVLVDAVGSDAAMSGIRVGDLVIPIALVGIKPEGEGSYRPMVEEKNIAFFVTDVLPEELLVQTDSGTRYVPFDSEEAAQSFGAPPTERKSEAA
jgi:hypothetical protein